MKEFESNPTIEDLQKDVPFIVYEGTQARNERTLKRLIIALVITVVLLFSSNMAWLYYENLFDSYSYDQDGDGINSINTGNQGDLDNEPTSENKD